VSGSALLRPVSFTFARAIALAAAKLIEPDELLAAPAISHLRDRKLVDIGPAIGAAPKEAAHHEAILVERQPRRAGEQGEEAQTRADAEKHDRDPAKFGNRPRCVAGEAQLR
jgi:hypothetical protein